MVSFSMFPPYETEGPFPLLMTGEHVPREEIDQRFRTVEQDIHEVRSDLSVVKNVHQKQAEDIAVIRTVAEKMEQQMGEMKNQPYKVIGLVGVVVTVVAAIIGFGI